MVILSIIKTFIKINNTFRQEDVISFETKELILKNNLLIISDLFEYAS